MCSAAEEYRKQFSSLHQLGEFLAARELASDEALDLLLLDQFLCWQTSQPRPLQEYTVWMRQLNIDEGGWEQLITEEFGYWEDEDLSFDTERFVESCRELPSVALRKAQQLVAQKHSAEIPSTEHQRVREIGRYQVLRQLGAGQFGVVYLADDPQLQRKVAIKLPSQDAVALAGGDEAVIREARLVAALDHPGIVPVYDVGRTPSGQLYIVAKFINGQDLASKLSQNRLMVSEAVRLIGKVARALHAAHIQGQVHRDVKPANILIDLEGEPTLVDFGLAIRDGDPRTSHLAGSPAYMSPEQARAEGHRVDARSDVYSLGVILYELLTGARPHDGKTSAEVLDSVRHREVRPPRQRSDSIPRELDRICMRALAARVSDRYSTALDLAEDLEEFMASQGGAFSRKVLDATETGSGTEPCEPLPGTGSQANSVVDSEPPRIVPKGLRAFDAGDAEFFLDLLPGPRDRHGLPEIVRLWKHRFESQAPDPVVPVGLLYGPSGCGKSSLVRAGILPRLDSHITSLIINAKAGDCAEVVLSALRSAIPKLKPSTLAEAIFELRRGTTVGRVLLILDQFEQWLQTWDGDPHCPLVEALRQCDGQRVQVLLMVRDDFWMSAARLMRELDAQIIEGVNATSLDAFTERHAHKVLFACGQAHGVVDAQSPSMENRQFVERAVAELSDHGKVFPVRLALFVQMMHARPWSPETLTTFGGIAGIGVKFLEESFGRLAPARFRSHATAVQQILAALMPGASSNIRGEPCGRSRLMVVSGYGERPADFSEVLMFLDSELRLLTPVEGTGDEVYYQLTHDYLVPSIRQWLDQQRTTTWAGRSEVALELRADMWHRRSEWRALPTPLEFLGILTWTQQRRWTVPQSQMMRAATRAYAIVASLLILIFISATWISRELYGRTQANRVYAQLLVSEMNEIPDLLPIAERWQKWVQPLLASGIASTETDKRARRNLALAALSYDPSHLDAVLSEAVGCSHAELPVFADRLRQVSPMRSGKIVETLSNVLLANHRAPRLRAAALLASLGTEDALQVCQAQIDTVTADLLSSPSDLSGFLPWFQPMGASLQAALQLNLRHEDESRRELAALALKENFNGSASELVELLEQANAAQFRALIELAKGRDDELIPLLRQRLELKRFPPWPARPHSSRKVELALIAQFESAMGWIDEDFAICQWLPIEDVFEVVRQLREAGYRLDRLRPFSTEQGLRVAAIWLRDQRAWDWCLGLSRSELQQRIDTETGLLPQDVAGYLPWVADMEGTPADDEPLFTFVWIEPRFQGEKREVYFGLPTAQSDPYQQRLRSRGFREIARHLYTNRQGDLLQHSMIWGLDAAHIAGSMYDVKTENSIEPFSFSFEAPVDLCVVPVDDPRCDTFYGGIWLTEDRQYDHQACLRMNTQEHLERMKSLAEQGFRPSSISVAEVRSGVTQSTSVWLRPRPSIEQRWQYASQQANCVAALLRLGQTDVLPTMLDSSADPAAAAEVIHSLASHAVEPALVFESLISATHPYLQANLLLALGEYSLAELAVDDPASTTSPAVVVGQLRNSPAASVRSAAVWCWRHWGQAGGTSKPSELDSAATWFIDVNGHEMIVVDTRHNPEPFQMGSYPSEPGASWDERIHLKWIKRRFAVCAYETTIEQFERFVASKPDTPFAFRVEDEPHTPVTRVSWLLAAEYCNWLSEQAGLSASEWCYEITQNDATGPRYRLAEDYLSRHGFRLPSEAEWEYCCRAGSSAARPFGDAEDRLSAYAWFEANADNQLHQVGMCKPNALGFFDMLGNAREWCQEHWSGKLTRIDTIHNNDHEDSLEVDTNRTRVTKGGSFDELAIKLRSANRVGMHPHLRLNSLGFRVARTVEDPTP